MAEIQRRGLMLVLSSPSGAGKTTISRRILEAEPDRIAMSVSVTTRKPRPGEVDGKDYFFIDSFRFDEMMRDGELLEYAQVFGNFYGSPWKPVDSALSSGRDVLFDIDWQGTQQLRQKARGDLVSVFLLPPSMKELEKRLRQRAQDSEEVVRARMAKAAEEISHWPEYDYVIINDDLGNSVAQTHHILTVERLRRERQIGLVDFARGLMRRD